MCVTTLKKEDYMGMYFLFDGKMREYLNFKSDDKIKFVGLQQMQGYEMLRIAWMANKVEKNCLTEKDMLDIVKQNISVSTAKIEVEESKNQRDPVLQKMIEVIRVLGENVSPLEFVREL